MDERLKGKVAIVTGAGSSAPGIGNGRAAAIIFARSGAKVLVVDLNRDAAQETVDAIKAEGGTAEIHAPADVTDVEHCRAMADHALKSWGRLDILVNNVGVSAKTRTTVVDADLDDFARVMTVNVQSIMHTSRFAVPLMARSGGGSIINIGSFGGLYPSFGNNAYAASKGAIISLTRSLAVDHGKDGIRANCIAPGMMITPMGLANKMGAAELPADREKRQEAEKERRRKLTLLGIDGTGWDIGNAALFLASDESRYITGITLLVDGGASLK